MVNSNNISDRKLAAIMFIDIADYSKMMGQNESATLKLLNDFEVLIPPIITNHSGTIIKKMGDGLFCEFNSALHAAECGLQIQKDISNFNKISQNIFTLHVRIGIHLGDVVKKGEDLFSDAINVASRIETKAEPGGLFISESVYQTIRNQPNLKFKFLGKINLKNIAHPHNVYKIITGPEPFPQKNVVITFIFIIVIIFVGYLAYNNLDFEFLNLNNNIKLENKLSPETQEFLQKVLVLKNSQTLISFLKEKEKNGELSFGNKNEYSNLENKIIIIADEQNIYSALIYTDSIFFDYVKNEKFESLSEYYSGKRTIWIELLTLD